MRSQNVFVQTIAWFVFGCR